LMAGDFFPISDFSFPQILTAKKDFLVVFKPPRMHSIPLENGKDQTLLDWYSGIFPEIAELPGRRAGEGGLLHRLDYETQGLMLIARTVTGMESLLEQQKKGFIFKEYSALTAESNVILPGFPSQKPEVPNWVFTGKDGKSEPVQIKSAFRPYGVGRKSVRPVVSITGQTGTTEKEKKRKEIALDSGEPYTTGIIEAHSLGSAFISLRVRIHRGFRHQIRNHMAWIGRPVLNDDLYGGLSYGKGFLGLRACSLVFNDPTSGGELAFSIAPLDLNDLI